MGIIDRATIDKARQTGTLYLSHLNLHFHMELDKQCYNVIFLNFFSSIDFWLES